MPPVTKHSNSLTARQRARKATQEHQERLKRRQSVLTDVFSALDARDAADIAAGEAIIKLKEISGTNAEIATELGLTTRDVSQLIKIAEQHANPDDSADKDDADFTDDSIGAGEPSYADSDGPEATETADASQHNGSTMI